MKGIIKELIYSIRNYRLNKKVLDIMQIIMNIIHTHKEGTKEEEFWWEINNDCAGIISKMGKHFGTSLSDWEVKFKYSGK